MLTYLVNTLKGLIIWSLPLVFKYMKLYVHDVFASKSSISNFTDDEILNLGTGLTLQFFSFPFLPAGVITKVDVFFFLVQKLIICYFKVVLCYEYHSRAG